MVVSIPLAVLVSYSRPVERAILPIIVALQIIPKIAIAPLFIIWFGFGLAPKLLLVFLLCFFAHPLHRFSNYLVLKNPRFVLSGDFPILHLFYIH